MSEHAITVLIAIITSGFGFAASWYVSFSNRKNSKAQTEGFIAAQYHGLTERLGQERDELLQRIARNDEHIKTLERKHSHSSKEINILKEDNHECKYLHEVAELELRHLSKSSLFANFKKVKVFVLDDDEDVLDEFKQRFNRLSVLEFLPFLDVEKFLTEVRVAQPQIIVIDYILNAGMTAEDVLESLNYHPEIFIMSTEGGYKKMFEGKNVKFFVKEKNYILEIVRDIIKYLNK